MLTGSHTPATTESPIIETTVGELLRDAAARWPQRTGLIEADVSGALGRRWTFAQLADDAERLALALASRYAPGERICVWAPNLPEWVILQYAAALAGLTLVTANPAYQPRELKFVLEQSRSAGLFIAPTHRGNPMAAIAAEVAAGVATVREVVDVTRAEQLFAMGTARRGLPEVRPDDPAQIQYTSGTTGFPKGALLHHRGVLNNARLSFERIGVREGQAVLNFMPMFHIAGCGLMTLGSIQVGSPMIIAALFNPDRMLDIVAAEQPALMIGVPTMLVALLEAQAAHPRDVDSLQMIVSGGAMVPPELVRRVREVFGCGFQTVYGQTEASGMITQTAGDDALDDLCDTVGRPLPQAGVSIHDPIGGGVVPVGQVGEICVRGYLVMPGYNDNAEASAAAIDADGWLHTGDLGAMDDRGYVRVTGRVKEMIIRGGENLFPAEIENILLEHADVAEVAVVGVPDARWGEVVACFVRLAPGVAFDPAALKAHCRANLSAPKTPTHWIAMTEWPLTGSGKIQKFVLRDRFVAGELEALSA